MFWYYENRNQVVKMHLDHSVHNRPMEKIEKNDTGSKCRKMNTSDWTAALIWDLKSYWGGMEGGATPFPAELYQTEEEAPLFLFPFFITFH